VGAYTTFSTFAFPSAALARESQWWLMAANLLSQNALGVALILFGVAIGKLV